MIVLFILIGSYASLVCYFLIIWKSIDEANYTNELKSENKISVVIAVKNEASNIITLLDCLVAQQLYKELFEVIIIDDNSTDETFDIVSGWIEKQINISRNFKVIRSFSSGKKAAIGLGINHSTGNIIVCTDGDCRVGEKWLSTIYSYFIQYKPKLLFGPVTFYKEYTSWNKAVQAIEFASLVGSGAASWKMGFPTMCNGANIAYLKSTFYEVNGFEGNEEIQSGDDEFLMHKVHALYPKNVHFIKSIDIVVETEASCTFKDFFKQRLRWAGKWENYSNKSSLWVAIYIFSINLAQIISFALLPILSRVEICIILGVIVLRWIIEYLFLKDVLRFMDKKLNLSAFLPLICIYPLYVVFFALAGRIKNLIGNTKSILNV